MRADEIVRDMIENVTEKTASEIHALFSKIINVEIVNKSSNTLPEYAEKFDSGMDVRADEDKILGAGERAIIKTGLFPAIPPGYEIQVRSRSGLAIKKGVFVLNSPGTIDASYRGEIGVILRNTLLSPFPIKIGDKIAQLVLVPICICQWKPVSKLSESDRGEGGFGSTGV